MLTATLDDKEIRQFINSNMAKLKPEFNKLVYETSKFALNEVKRVDANLPKRSGGLRSSYKDFKTGEFERTLATNLKYAGIIEDGGTRPEIRPKKRKRLTIPINDKALTNTKAKIKQSSLNRLFKQVGISKSNKLYSKIKGKSVYQSMQEVGIVLAKRARSARIPAQHNIRDKVVPKVLRFMELGFLRLDILNR
jgi:hypothetical protein